jgi:hypothetical protein
VPVYPRVAQGFTRPLDLPPRLKNLAAPDWLEGPAFELDARDGPPVKPVELEELRVVIGSSEDPGPGVLIRSLAGGGGAAEKGDSEGRVMGAIAAEGPDEEAKEDVLAQAEELPDAFPVGEGGTEKNSESSMVLLQSYSGEADLVKDVKSGEPPLDSEEVDGPAKEVASIDASGSSSSSLTSMTAPGLSSSLLFGIMNFFFLMDPEANRVLRLAAASLMSDSGRTGSRFSTLTAIFIGLASSMITVQHKRLGRTNEFFGSGLSLSFRRS